ncbi:DUF4381 family protein [Pseudoalteromonas luteoviolacea]|uniref:DUF4381 domain-containing protein n=1 Tax=Pseudoalteromonas luteoviolacea DSM 6061 TaxID=1365250 RepID=A0A166V592_9GAMM|nr:DUF4381 family protein [Pseudoalteromonas luteoviolacea]KZN31728.1 hypothetical protein N475_04535 [Pseudoalteromonas luteoviolacea DSM 6061]KZN54588.1 hypothetical protein N474_02355 [Pseudoalteromonas luteoviolacea CPMOR-2]MBE0389065.1 hypothetical protein [Pseudoalteromonas luteoviolacea DSM 6061]TQF70421.1 DUF4381 domain-containing protein [Pseudoalteromonas luteoviolacea]
MTPSPLDALNDVLPPEQVSWWPLSLPMWALILITIILLICFGVFTYRRWQFSAAKREAIKLSADYKNDPLKLHGLLKRLTKHYYGNQASSQSSANWCKTLNSLSKVNFQEADIVSLYNPDPNNDLQPKLIEAIKTYKTKERLDV